MKNSHILFLLVSLLLFAGTLKAEYVSENVTFKEAPGKQIASVDLDFSSYDLSTASNFTISFPLGLVSYFTVYNQSYSGEFEISAGTTYSGTLSYGLGVTADKGNGNTVQIADVLTPNYFNASYTIDQDVKLPQKQEYAGPNTADHILPTITLSDSDFLNLLDSNNHLRLDMIFTGPDGRLDNFPYTAGINPGYGVDSLVGLVEVSFNTTPVTPEPASLLIFGTAALFGIPVIRRFRRK
ncbi:MAG: hypothetical protein LBQ50_06870 [Planctomycetaceae bacterium]|nr:hypothetical protein [Planctomycetaceae bacterium]